MTFKLPSFDDARQAFSQSASDGESQPTKEYETISLSLPVKLVKQMQAICDRDDVTMSEVCNYLIGEAATEELMK